MTLPTHYEHSGNEVWKVSDNRQIVGGWFTRFVMNGVEVVDTDNETIHIDSYVDSAIDFVRNQRTANFNHENAEIPNTHPPRGALIDSLIVDTEAYARMLVRELTGMTDDQFPITSLGHFGSFQIFDPDDYAQIVTHGAMFSIEGSCDRVLEEEDADA